MLKKRLSILLLLVIFFSYLSISVNAVYNVEITNGMYPKPSIVDQDGNEYENGGTGLFIERYKKLATFVGGLGTITMVAAVIFNLLRLNVSLSNPVQRQQCIRGVLVCGIFAALLGGATLYIGLFYGLLR